MNSTALVLMMLAAADPQRAVDFDTQLIPIFTRHGCNAGACHGAAAGRGGFRLSLLGSNPALDYQRIVFELEGRRINLAHPEQSLLVAKPTELITHGGGTRLEYDGPEADLITEWIRAGAPRLQRRELVRYEVRPLAATADHVGQVIPVRSIAHFSDGSREDVTEMTVFTPGDDAALQVAHNGDVTVKRRGRHTLMLRYLDRVVAVTLLMPLRDENVDLSDVAVRNFIDEQVLATLATLGIPVSPPADDATLLRRTYLDLTGRLPAPNEVRSYLADSRADKHALLVERLLQSAPFNDYWTLYWAQLLRVRSTSMDQEGARAFHGWLRRQVARNRPIDEMVREMLLATGDSHKVGPANFSRAAGSPRDQAEFVSEALLGARLRCANCHDHPLDRWTQDDYHGLAAIFARMERGRHVRVSPRGDVTHPRTGEPALPRIPGERSLSAEGDHREELADWIVSPDNPLFARAMVNRLWKQLMGRGLVDPVDDLRATNPATHPELLDRLADDFVDHRFDLRHTLRTIVTSATYARSSSPLKANANDDRFYSHMSARALSAEVLADAFSDVTGIADRYGEAPPGTRAVELVDGDAPSPALDILGRCSREASCESNPDSGGLALTLHLINGELINRKITDPSGRLRQSLEVGKSDAELLDEFYLRALSRFPSDQERRYWLNELSTSGADRASVWEDFLWALLNSREFATNH